jgi:hypothetical protein
MGLFSSSATLEQRVAQLESDLAASAAQVSTLTDDLATASQRALTAEGLVVTLTAERDAATAAHAACAAENAVLCQVANLIGLTAEAVAALTPETAPAAFAAAFEARAGARAVELAASQGVPAIPTEPSGTVADSDEAIYDRFAAADSAEATRMFQDATLGPVIRRESARRHAAA